MYVNYQRFAGPHRPLHYVLRRSIRAALALTAAGLKWRFCYTAAVNTAYEYVVLSCALIACFCTTITPRALMFAVNS